MQHPSRKRERNQEALVRLRMIPHHEQVSGEEDGGANATVSRTHPSFSLCIQIDGFLNDLG